MSATATRLLPFLCSVLLLAAEPAEAVSPTATPPTPSPFVGAASATPTGTPRPPASATRTFPSASPTVGSRRSDVGGSETAPDGTAADDGSARPAATAAVARPRVFRTPERAAPPAFVAPGGAAEEGDGMAAPDVPEPAVGNRPPAPRAGSGLVVFHVTARTALEGFDLRVAYPRSLGAFGNSAKQAECNAGTGALVVANDHGGDAAGAGRERDGPAASRSTSSAASRSSRARVSTPAPSPCGSRRSRATASEPIRRSSW